MSNPLPLVSFAIPSYNHEKYLGEMLDSCLAQTYPNIEVVVVDDASPDGSRQILENYVRRYPGIVRAEFNETNLGPALTARRAVRLTRGEFIAGIGSDDVSLPHRIAAGMELMLANPSLGAVFSKAEIIDETSRTIDSPIAQVFNCAYDDIRWRLLSGNFLCGPSMLVRGDVVRKISPNPSLGYVEDFDQCLRILDTHELLRVDDVWVKYRSHGKNLSVHTRETIPFAGNYETAISILSAIERWPLDKLFTFQSPSQSAKYKLEVALARCRLAEHCIRMDDSLFGRPFLMTSEAYRQLLIATESDPQCERLATLLAEIWNRLGDHPRADGKKPISFDDWRAAQGGTSAADIGARNASRPHTVSFEEAYARWQGMRTFVPSDTDMIESSIARWTPPPRIHLVLRLAQGDETQLADTLDSLAQQLFGEWHLDIITTLPSPDGLDQLPCIGWHTLNNPDEAKVAIDFLAEVRKFDWLLEIPAGAQLDPLCLWRIASQAQEQPTARAFFVDDDCCDDSGKRHSPRFKPGCNPLRLQSEDLAGPLAISHDAWKAIGGASPMDSPWFHQLLRLATCFGWSAIQHIPDVLITYPVLFPSHTQSCRNALLEHHQANNMKAELIPVGDTNWNIRYEHTVLPPVSIGVLSQGQLDLLARCIESITKKTIYPFFEILIVYEDCTADPELPVFMEHLRKHQAIRSIAMPTSSNHAARCNRAAREASHDFLVLMQEEAVPLHENWLEELVRLGNVPSIGAVSPRMFSPGRLPAISNAGSVLGLGGVVGSPFLRSTKLNDTGYHYCLHIGRDVSALPNGAFLINKQAYIQAGGMDEMHLGNHLAEIDLSIKIRKMGLRLVFQPKATIAFDGTSLLPEQQVNSGGLLSDGHLASAESTLLGRWGKRALLDPYWNNNLSRNDPIPRIETEFRPQWQYLPSNTPRILAHTLNNGQGYFRVTSALSALRTIGQASECVWQQEGSRTPSLAEILAIAPDALIVQHYIQGTHLAALNSWQKVPDRPFIVFTADDLLTDLPETNPMRHNIPPNSRASLKYALDRCDRLVVSTEFLAECYQGFIKDIHIVPNRLEQRIWSPLTTKKRVGKKPRIGWAGGTTHHGDLILLREVIEQTRSEADWIFFGMCPNEIHPLLSEYHPLGPFNDYPMRLASLNLDIAVAPLTIHPFNQAKSNLRLLEYGILGIPVVCTDIDPYRNAPVCRVKNSPSDWIDAIRARIHDADACDAEGRELKQWVQRDYLLENHLHQWLEAHLP